MSSVGDKLLKVESMMSSPELSSSLFAVMYSSTAFLSIYSYSKLLISKSTCTRSKNQSST